MSDQPTELWGILELLGHVRIAGRITEESRFGVALGRIDIPKTDGTFTTQFFSGSSIYRLTPTTEEIARSVAVHHQPEPVYRFELPTLAAQAATSADEEDDEEPDADGHYGGRGLEGWGE